MEKRLTAQGPKDRKSYTVTLPIEWIKKNKIEKNKIVNLEIAGEAIVINKSSREESTITLDANLVKNSFIKVIQSCYRTGSTKIKINYTNPEVLSEIRMIIEEKSIGYEIIEQKKNYLIIKDITNASGDDFKTVFRRIFLLLIELSNSNNLEEATSLKKSISKFSNYCQRILVTRGQSDYEKIPSYFLMLDRFEKISDEIVWMIEENSKINTEITKIIRECYEINYVFKLDQYNKLVANSFFKRNESKKTVTSLEKMREYNVYRLINSLVGDIANINLKNNFEEKNT